jgi:hypothetical protein
MVLTMALFKTMVFLMVFANVVCVSIFNAAEGLTDDVVTELVKTVEAREKYAKEVRISRTRRAGGE